ncbi:MAG: hypothetical protein HY924_16815 [Elusimicrobia bacterium]|nr:hypothetical protein [Elusimicrobiota bacterium]
MNFYSLRWVFLACGLVFAFRFLVFSRTPAALAPAASCFLAWAVLSRLKARSADGPRR